MIKYTNPISGSQVSGEVELVGGASVRGTLIKCFHLNAQAEMSKHNIGFLPPPLEKQITEQNSSIISRAELVTAFT